MRHTSNSKFISKPIDDIFFDCDSTLSSIEGIDELAARLGKGAEIAALTNAAMNGEVKLEDVYAERLRRIQPTRADLDAIAEAYRRTAIPDAKEVIARLSAIGKRVFVVSGGMAEAVVPFALWLGVPPGRIFAVPVLFDENGRFAGVAPSPLTTQTGKTQIIRAAREQGRAAMLVGDGSSDLAAREAVDMFVGFGGVVARPLVAQHADVFIRENSLRQVVELAEGKK